MEYISTTLPAVMTVLLIICGTLLWRRRTETGDYSRTIQALFSYVSAAFTFTFIFRNLTNTTAVDSVYFNAEHIFVPILCQTLYFFYPLEVIRPTISRSKVYTLMFAPLLLLVFVGVCAGIQYTPIYNYADLWQHIGEFNVWFRLLSLAIMVIYCFSLFLVPYDWRHSSVNRKLILGYAFGFCLIGLLHFAVMCTHNHWLVIAHQMVWISLFSAVTYYELHERLLPPKSNSDADPASQQSPDSSSDSLWELIQLSLDMGDLWRSPELSLTSLAERLDSNRTYVGEAFKRNTGMTFVEYVTRRRIDYVVEALNKDPKANIQELFNYVGYRQRSTAWRNFQKIVGVTPTEYLEGLK